LIPELQKLNLGRYFIPAPEGTPLPLSVQGLIIATLAAHDVSISTFFFLQLSLAAKNVAQFGSA
jgi:hypothetical protein